MGTAKRYVWNKYSTDVSYEIGTEDEAAYAAAKNVKSSTTYAYFSTKVTYDEDTGYFTASGTIKGMNVGTAYLNGGPGSSYHYYLGSSKTSTTCYYTEGVWTTYVADEDASSFSIYSTKAVYKVVAEEVYSQGDTDYGYVSSKTSGTYPTDGQSGNYWYTYLGTDYFGIKGTPTFSPSTPLAGSALTVSFTPYSNTYGGTITYKYRYGTWESSDEVPTTTISADDFDSYFPTEISETTGTTVSFTVPSDAAYIGVLVTTVSDGLGWTGDNGYYKTAACYVYSAPEAPESVDVASSRSDGYFIASSTTATITWDEVEDADDDLAGYLLERSYNGGSYTQIYQGTTCSYSEKMGSGWTTVQYRVRAYDDEGLYSDYTYSDEVTVITNTAPSAPAAVTLPTNIYTGVQYTVSWTASTDSEGDTVYYQVQVSYNSGTSWSTVSSKTTKTSLTATITSASTSSVMYRVRAYDSYSFYSSYTYSSERTVINNTAPTITVKSSASVTLEDGYDFGTFTDANDSPVIAYLIFTDEQGDDVEWTMTVDGTVIRSGTAAISSSSDGTTYSYEFTSTSATYIAYWMGSSAWQKLLNGEHTIVVTADDGTDTGTWTGTFTKDVNSCQIVKSSAVTTDSDITGVLMSITPTPGSDADVTVLVTADGGTNWEDASANVTAGTVYYFSNTGTSFLFDVTIERGEDSGYVSSIQGVLLTEDDE